MFNLKTRQILRLRERPLIAMDTTMLATKYMGFQPEQIIEQIAHFGNICRQYGCDLRLLWHNTNLVEEWQQSLYIKILKELLKVPH